MVFVFVQAIIVAGLFLFALHQIDQTFVRSIKFIAWLLGVPRKMRGQKMVGRAKKVGSVLIYNTESRTTAVTSAFFFKGALAAQTKHLIPKNIPWKDVLADRELRDKWRNSMIMRQRIEPLTVYSFADGTGVLVPGHTGDATLMDSEINKLVVIMTGIEPTEVPEKDLKTTINLLVQRDSRLLVPFADGGKSLSDEQLRRYSDVSVETMLDCLIPSSTRPKY
jgi:hypothetical protein